MKSNSIKKITYLLALIIVLGFALTACANDGDADADGKTVSAKAAGYGGDVTVEVTVGGDKISNVKVDAPKETPEIGGEAAKKIGEEIVSKQSLNIDAVSGATITSNAVLKAAEEALKEAGMDTEALK
jgi:fumarate reductase flavoprotein subunit